MNVVAVPVKPLHRAKSRLAPLLSPSERASITVGMLEDVLAACRSLEGWRVWVVSHAEPALAVAARLGATPVEERGRSLAEAVRQAEDAFAESTDTDTEEGHSLAVVLADLPFVTAAGLAEALADPSPVVAAPASSDGGTNVLVRRPPSVIRARFGRSSFAKHRWAARRAGVAFAEHASEELGFDLDRPEDLVRVVGGRAGTRTEAVCRELGLAERLRRRA
jgi:2-phospho-L-lactate/phosphoenolpyruvate guanylyltransferase